MKISQKFADDNGNFVTVKMTFDDKWNLMRKVWITTKEGVTKEGVWDTYKGKSLPEHLRSKEDQKRILNDNMSQITVEEFGQLKLAGERIFE